MFDYIIMLCYISHVLIDVILYGRPELPERGGDRSLSVDTGVREKENSSGEEEVCESQHSKHQIGGWRAVSSTGMQGKGCHKRNDFISETPVGSGVSGFTGGSGFGVQGLGF